MSYIVRIVFYMMSCGKKPAKFPNFSPLRQNQRLIQRKFSDKEKASQMTTKQLLSNTIDVHNSQPCIPRKQSNTLLEIQTTDG